MKQSKTKKSRSASKGTEVKYAKVVEKLMKLDKPTKINGNKFSKENKVSSHLLYALRDLGYLEASANGFKWLKTTDSVATIANKVRIACNKMTNKKKPLTERPRDKRAFHGKKSTKSGKRTPRKTTVVRQAPTTKGKRKTAKVGNVPNLNSKTTELAKLFAMEGDIDFALTLMKKRK